VPEVALLAATEIEPNKAFDRICDFPKLAQLSTAVRHIDVFEEDGRSASRWEVNFRRGVLIWSEWDVFDRDARSINFTRRDGDPVSFDGGWLVSPAPTGSVVSFRVSFDLGMPTLADVVDPIAARTLRTNLIDVFKGALGPIALLDEEAHEQ
jgi:hypothetical protein